MLFSHARPSRPIGPLTGRSLRSPGRQPPPPPCASCASWSRTSSGHTTLLSSRAGRGAVTRVSSGPPRSPLHRRRFRRRPSWSLAPSSRAGPRGRRARRLPQAPRTAPSTPRRWETRCSPCTISPGRRWRRTTSTRTCRRRSSSSRPRARARRGPTATACSGQAPRPPRSRRSLRRRVAPAGASSLAPRPASRRRRRSWCGPARGRRRTCKRSCTRWPRSSTRSRSRCFRCCRSCPR